MTHINSSWTVGHRLSSSVLASIGLADRFLHVAVTRQWFVLCIPEGSWYKINERFKKASADNVSFRWRASDGLSFTLVQKDPRQESIAQKRKTSVKRVSASIKGKLAEPTLCCEMSTVRGRDRVKELPEEDPPHSIATTSTAGAASPHPVICRDERRGDQN